MNYTAQVALTGDEWRSMTTSEQIDVSPSVSSWVTLVYLHTHTHTHTHTRTRTHTHTHTRTQSR